MIENSDDENFITNFFGVRVGLCILGRVTSDIDYRVLAGKRSM